VAFSKVLHLVEDACDWVWRGPEWARPVAGGVVLDGLLIALPQMYGVGYPVLENAVEGRYAIGMIVVLMLGKMLATSLTIGIGDSGGVFAPTLFIGAMAGTALGTVAHQLLPGVTEWAGAYGLIGMGAALGGATGAPITAVIILFELTGECSIILPLMAAVVMAAGTGHLLSKNTIYTAKLWRRGVDLDATPAAHPDFTAADVAVAAPEPLSVRTSLDEAAAALAASSFGMLPVVGDDGRYTGCVSAQDVAEALAKALDHPGRTREIEPLVGLPAVVSADTSADGVLARLNGRGGTGLPVLDSERSQLVGWITYESVLAKLRPGNAARAVTYQVLQPAPLDVEEMRRYLRALYRQIGLLP
jgi:chloride channel protein, CIC family